MNLPTGRNHRTALVIDTRSGVTSDFRNRYERLLESVNSPGIMVDVYTLRGDVIAAAGAPLVSGAPGASVAAETTGAVDLADWAAEQGYTMLLVASPLGV